MGIYQMTYAEDGGRWHRRQRAAVFESDTVEGAMDAFEDYTGLDRDAVSEIVDCAPIVDSILVQIVPGDRFRDWYTGLEHIVKGDAWADAETEHEELVFHIPVWDVDNREDSVVDCRVPAEFLDGKMVITAADVYSSCHA